MVVNVNYTLKEIVNQIVCEFNPEKIILFGSVAKCTNNLNSDIDLCIIKDTSDKRNLIATIYSKIDSNIPFDILVYTNEEWEKNANDSSSFAYIINKTGVVLYG